MVTSYFGSSSLFGGLIVSIKVQQFLHSFILYFKLSTILVFAHDSAATLIINGEIFAAAQEEVLQEKMILVFH